MSVFLGARMYGSVYGTPGEDAPWNTQTWDEFEVSAGRRVSLVAFGQPAPWDHHFEAAPLDDAWKRGAVPLCSMDVGHATLADVAAGRYDAQIAMWAVAARLYGKPLMLRWCWEMNNPRYKSWGPEAAADPKVYVAAWRKFFWAVQREGATNVTSVWCPNVSFPGSTPLKALWPGTATVDWMGIDGYNFGGAEWRSFAETFDHTYIELLAISSRPIVVGEVGCAEAGGSKAAWITDMFAALPIYQRIRAVSWFNSNLVEKSAPRTWPIESSPAGRDAFRVGASAARYLGPLAGLPAGSKVKPL